MLALCEPLSLHEYFLIIFLKEFIILDSLIKEAEWMISYESLSLHIK